MRNFGKVAMSALMLAGASMLTATPASAQVDVGISFGYGPGFVPYSDPCAYYDYYDEPPPWGLPPDYCDYPVYFEPVFWGGEWYRGPIYSRWYGGERLFWLNGGWRHDEWRGSRPEIRWEDRGGWGHGRNWGRGGYDHNRSYYSGGGHNWSGGSGGHNNWSVNSGNWSGNGGGGHNWSGGNGGHNNWSGGGHNWSGGGGHIYSGGGGGGGHNWSGGGGGGHGWSGGGGGGGHGEGGHGVGHGGHR
ncbi:MAG: hypothetical protein KGM97_08855 [Alphaproteobacteria bacterium]|nr:hypothetical protein [Alphaproteobacteria bacterium]MDE2631084.1 hypothetical protein [Alphaproteobacteria bacterium]